MLTANWYFWKNGGGIVYRKREGNTSPNTAYAIRYGSPKCLRKPYNSTIMLMSCVEALRIHQNR